MSAEPGASHRQLDGPGDGLVQAGVEQPQPVDACSPITESMRSAAASWAWSASRVWSAVLPGATVVPGGADLGQLPAGLVGVQPPAGVGEDLAPLGDVPDLLDAGVEAAADLEQPVLERTLRHVADGLVEAAAGLHGVADELPPRLLHPERVDARALGRPGGWRGRPAPRSRAARRARRSGRTRARPTAAAAPVARMADGEVTARATFGLKNRSRKLSRTGLEVAHDRGEHLVDRLRVGWRCTTAELVASAIVRSTPESAPEVKAIGKMRTGLPVSPCGRPQDLEHVPLLGLVVVAVRRRRARRR